MKDLIQEQVSDYYANTLTSTQDLKTSACCTNIEYPDHIRSIINEIHDEVTSKYYGCGLTIPEQIEDLTILDLGSGSGRDAYILSKLAGEKGKVIGIDMTREQLEVANRHKQWHADKFGFQNVEFLEGQIEKLHDTVLEDESIDLIVSNCVVNLATDKQSVLKGVHSLLTKGGEFYFSDIYADRRIPSHLKTDPILYGECLSGALYWNDFISMAKQTGFTDPRVVHSSPVEITNPDIKEKTGNIRFYSVTYRLFKLSELESDCEDYGQAIRYKGSVAHNPHLFQLDDHHAFETGRIYKVCGNTYRMLNETRFSEHFDFWGDFSTHYGIFEGCGGNAPFDTISGNEPMMGSASCC